MRRLPYFILAITAILAWYAVFSTQVKAAGLTNTSLILERNKENTATGGTVCAKTPNSSSGTVGKVSIAFPSGFSVNSTASHWTVSTSDLPSGATAWPGIGTANNISGSTVFFPSNNLSTNTFYCFNFSGTNTLTTNSKADDQQGTISTLTTSGTLLDSANYAVSTVQNDQVNVNGTVAANPNNYFATLASNTSGTVQQYTTISYTLTYGSTLSSPSNITVEAHWSLGTVSGQGTPTVDVLNYVANSASNAYGNTPPVIDTLNRKITWDISSFPGNSGSKTVTFQLQTNSSYTGSSPVTFTTSGKVLGPGIETADSNIYLTYQYNNGTTTPTPTQIPTSTPVPGLSGTLSPTGGLTPTSTPQPSFQFSKVAVRTVSFNSAGIYVSTNTPARARILYGTSTSDFSKNVLDDNYTRSHTISLNDLSPNTTYYFYVKARDTSDNVINSDIYTFKTALVSLPPEIDYKTVIFTSDNNVITDNNNVGTTNKKSVTPVVLLPQNTPYQITFSLQGRQSIKRVQAVLRNSKVLGINTAFAEAEVNTEVVEVQPGVYVARILGQPSPGTYTLFAVLYDNNGNVAEQKLATIKIVKPFTIFSKNNQPIEGASATLYVYNESTKVYLKVPGTATAPSPLYSNNEGVVNYVLPHGKYKVEVQAIGFKQKSVIFKIDNSSSDYPQVYLENGPFNLFTYLSYYGQTLGFIYINASTLILTLAQSLRFFDLVATFAFIFLIFTTIFAFCVRTHMRIEHLPLFFLYNIEDLLHIHKDRYVVGEVKDINTGERLSRAKISILDNKTGNLLTQAYTNKLGEFILRKPNAEAYKVVISKDGYNKITMPDYYPNSFVGKQEFIIQKSDEEIKPTLSRIIIGGGENVLSFIFEFLLINCIFYELIFVQVRGLARTAPFIIITLLTIFLWFFYARRVIRKTNAPQY